MKKHLMVFGAIALMAGSSFAAMKTKVVPYTDGQTQLEGYLVWDDAKTGKQPGVLITHEWWGHDAYARKRAVQVAQLGYVAFALDMYGKGVHTTDPKEAGRLATIYKSDRNLMRQRAAAGLKVLTSDEHVDPNKIVAMGYCFGGTCSLELARSGANLAGVISFHGGLDTPNIEDAKNIKGKVLVLHGGDDQFVPMKDVEAFMDEMRKANANWQVNIYGDSVHGFTNSNNGSDKSKGMAYNAQADKRSWKEMQMFMEEVFFPQK